HGYVNAPKYTKMWLYECLDKVVLTKMDKIVVVTSDMKALPALNRVTEKVKLIENGIKINFNRHNLNEVDLEIEQFFKRHSLVVGAVGRLSKEKGLRFLIEAFAEIRAHFKNVGLIILGEGKERPYLENDIVGLGLDSSVLMPGYRENPDVYIGRLSCLIMPSLTEGLPVTLLEAMSLKV